MPFPSPTDAVPFLDALHSLYTDMDRAYERIAESYGFRCDGCDDNCCTTRFHHHTLLEALDLKRGLASLEGSRASRVRERALVYRRDSTSSSGAEGRFSRMCPLNSAGRCLLYAHRPMICRLHGLPHELHLPGGRPVYGPGCEAFTRRCGSRACRPLDRTPFYSRMAALEKRLRETAGCTERIRLTVADMILREEGRFPS
jgi:Fe-S-cluster containining protein